MSTVLGLAGLAVFILAVIALAAAVTWAVVKITPSGKDDDGAAKRASAKTS